MSDIVDVVATKVEPEPPRALARAPEFSRADIDLIKRTVCPPDTTDDELKLFMHVARVSGLDPLRKQIHCTKRQGKLVIIAGIDGLQARAVKAPDFEGILHGVVCQKDELEFDAATSIVVKHAYNAFADRGPVVGAWATVRRKGMIPFTALVRFAEFNAPSNPTWRQMPHVMIDKVARSTALRMAYPEQFSALYEEAEMHQADNRESPPPAKDETPKALEDPSLKSLKQAATEVNASLRNRAKRLWLNAKNAGANQALFQSWAGKVLGKTVASSEWDAADIDRLEGTAQPSWDTYEAPVVSGPVPGDVPF